MGAPKNWYVIYTKPRWEKKVHQLLQEKGYESYCPVQKIKKRWSDRYKWVEEPLFKSYVFVYLSEEEKLSIRFVQGVVNFIYWLGKPAVVKPVDINRIKKFLSEYGETPIQIQKLEQGSEVRIESGAFMDQKGRVLKIGKKMAEVVIVSLGCKLVAKVDLSNISSTH